MGRIQRFVQKRKKDIPFWIEIQKRKYTSIFNYKRLAQDMELVTTEYPYNAYYGLDKIVKKIEGLSKFQRLEAGIEHGLTLQSEDVSQVLLDQNRIYVFGSERSDHIQKLHPDKEIVTHNNFISYVKGKYSPLRISLMKKKMGKTLLCFPTHSTHHIADVFDQDSLITEIDRIKEEHGFKTVLVCLYWKDILQGRDEPYIAAGYKIVTAGHLYDSFFLNRLKSIVQLSDMVITNGWGTHIGYAICENRPVYMFLIKRQYVTLDEEKCSVDEFNSIFETVEESDAFSNKFLEVFGSYSELISDEQRKFVRKYWGDF